MSGIQNSASKMFKIEFWCFCFVNFRSIVYSSHLQRIEKRPKKWRFTIIDNRSNWLIIHFVHLVHVGIWWSVWELTFTSKSHTKQRIELNGVRPRQRHDNMSWAVKYGKKSCHCQTHTYMHRHTHTPSHRFATNSRWVLKTAVAAAAT